MRSTRMWRGVAPVIVAALLGAAVAPAGAAAAVTTNDPFLAQLWGLQTIGAPEAWTQSTGSPTTVVAVVDTGVDTGHPDLTANVWTNPDEIAANGIDDDGDGKVDDVHGWDFVDGDADPADVGGGGTGVAGTVAGRGNNALGIAGVAWRATIMPLRAVDAAGTATDATVAAAFTYAADHGAGIVVAPFAMTGASSATEAAIAAHPHTLFVAAAGDGGGNDDSVAVAPCSLPESNIVCVAATDAADALAGFSNTGATAVDLGAPGAGVLSTGPRDVFTDDFESGLGKWTVVSGPWGTLVDGGTGNTTLADSPAGDYAADANSIVQTASKLDPAGGSDCHLRFSATGYVENGYDFFNVFSSTDGSTWTLLQQYTGSGPGAVDLSLGAVDARYYRFQLSADSIVQFDGISIDVVHLTCLGGAYQHVDSTAAAAAHVAGAAAVLLGADPSASVADLRAALLNTGAALPTLSGATATGRRLDLPAALDRLLHPQPLVTTGAATGVGATTATLHGQVTPQGKPATFHFELRKAAGGSYGALQTIDVAAGSGNAPVDVAAAVADLAPVTTYAYRLVAVNDGGTATAAEQTFTTADVPATGGTTTPGSAQPQETGTPPSGSATGTPPSGSATGTPAGGGTPSGGSQPAATLAAPLLACAMRRGAEPRVSCSVTYPPGSRRATIRLTRRGRAYATATDRHPRAGRAVRLHVVRRPAKGHYRVEVRISGSRGARYILSAIVRL